MNLATPEDRQTTSEPLLDMLGSVLGVVILLKNKRPTHILVCPRSHRVLRDVFVHKPIHDDRDLFQRTHSGG